MRGAGVVSDNENRQRLRNSQGWRVAREKELSKISWKRHRRISPLDGGGSGVSCIVPATDYWLHNRRRSSRHHTVYEVALSNHTINPLGQYLQDTSHIVYSTPYSISSGELEPNSFTDLY